MKRIKCFILLIAAVLATTSAYGQVTWYLEAGGIWGSSDMNKEYPHYTTGSGTFISDEYWNENYKQTLTSGYEISAGLYIQIPLKGHQMFLDTGLGWKSKNVISVRDANLNYNNVGLDFEDHKFIDYQGRINFLELPLRFGYQLNLNAKNSFQFKIGPYISYAINNLQNDWADYAIYGKPKESLSPVSVGLSPSIMFKHRRLAVGATLNTPCFFNGPRAYKSTSFNLVVAIHLGSMSGWDWDAIADGLDKASQAMGAVSNTLMEMQNNSQSYDGNSSYDESSSYSKSSASSSSKSSSGDKYNVSEQRACNTDKRTYSNYESQLASHFAGNRTMTSSEVRNAQSKMRQLRNKWVKKGYSFSKSPYEDK